MLRTIERTALFLADLVSLCAAWIVYHQARFSWGILDHPRSQPIEMLVPMLLIAAFWILLFFFFGLYRERFASSRFDEIITVVKVVTVGILVLFFLLFIEQLDAGSARKTMMIYWTSVTIFVSAGRFLVRTAQKMLRIRGYGNHRALVVGWDEKVKKLYEDVARYPAAGLSIVGAIYLTDQNHPPSEGLAGRPTRHNIESLPALIDQHEVQDVLITLGSGDHEQLNDVLRYCDGKNVTLKLVPDFYSVIGGMARTEHLYGLPLIDVLPMPMQPWEQSTKRVFDLLFSTSVLLIGLPLIILLILLVRLTSNGPAIYKQQRVGEHEKVFTMLKLRTMQVDAEDKTGPVWASANDDRYTPVGKWLRKLRLDELPQLWNVLVGDMSLVGPRPERPFFVDKLSKEIPLYKRRLRVKPGITGLAQVKWKYDTSLDDVRQKIKYDLFYIENMGLRMDLQILLQTIRIALGGEGQ